MSSALLSYGEAAALVAAHAARLSPPGTERVALAESDGRVLAETLRADRDQPPFSRSTRDGYA
ncbi:MAG: molybdopterin molybdenumtransferase MoeA, partial [Terracidiphilus sp.]